MTPSTGQVRGNDEFEVQVGDVTLVVRPEPAPAAPAGKYAARSAPAYGAVPAVEEDSPDVVATEESPDRSVDLLVDEPIPDWGEWRSEVVSSSAGYHRRETRLPR